MHRDRLRSLIVLAVFAALTATPAAAVVLDRTATLGAITVQYRLVLPDHYDPAKAYPAVLAFGDGLQTLANATDVVESYFRIEAERHGYIVIAPAAPAGQVFFASAARIFPAFLQFLLRQYRIQGGKFNAAGPANGGVAAFHVAALNPQYFLSVTAFPGYLADATPEYIRALSGLCINLFVGEFDPRGWEPLMSDEIRVFRRSGIHAQLTVEKDQADTLQTLQGPQSARLFDLFDQAQHGCVGGAP